MNEKLLDLRRKIKSKKPDYIRYCSHRKKALDESWRRPRGRHNKVKLKLKGKPSPVEVGYGSPREVRGLLSNGKRPILIRNIKDLLKINKETDIGILASNIGKRKREIILNKAKELGIEILNQ